MDAMHRALGSLSRPILALLLIPLLLWSGGSAHAQTAPAAASAPAADKVDPAEVERLVRTLEDPAQREALLKQLRTLAQAQEKVEGPPETVGTRVLGVLSDRVEDVSGQLTAAGRALVASPQAVRWLQRQVWDPETRSLWLRLLGELAIIVAAGYAARLLILFIMRRPRAALGARDPSGWIARILLLLVRTLLDVLPIAAFAVAGYGALSVTDPPRAVRLAAITFLNASILVQVVVLLARALFSPSSANLRLLRIGDETAHYLTIWVRRIAFTAVYGFFIAQAALMLGLPAQAYAALIKVVGLIVAGMLVILVLQNRRVVADWLRNDRVGGGAPAQDPDDAALAAVVGGTATAEEAHALADGAAATGDPAEVARRRRAETAGRALRAARRRLADVWHILAIVYIVAIYAIWALRIEGGFEYMLRATAVTLITLVVVRLLAGGVDRLIARAFAVAPELRAQYPQLEPRANRYLPILQRILKGALWFLGGLIILEAWGVDSLGWLGTDFGRRFSASFVSISIILLLAVLAWEVVSGLIERYLTGTDAGGRTVERSQRIRTLLPLLRNAFMILLVTLVTLTVLAEIGVDIAPLLAGAGVIGLAIGFGAQTLVKDVITGLFILIEDTVSVGDVVNVGGTGGVVEAISIRSLRLRDLTGTVHTIPFSNVTNVANLTKEFSFYVFNVGVAYREDTDRVVDVLKKLGEELQADPEYAPCILEPLEVMGVDAFMDSAVIIKCRFKTRPIKQWFVGREFNRRMKKRFDELGIEIPFPHRTVYLGVDNQGKAPPAGVALDDQDPARTVAAAAGTPANRG